MVFWSTEKKKEIAEESYKTRKAREKLRKMLEEHQSKITPQALEEKTIEIQRRIARHASNRVVLRNKSISLFDENQNAAQLSQKIAVLAEQMKKDIQVHNANIEPISKIKKSKKWIFTADVKKEEK